MRANEPKAQISSTWRIWILSQTFFHGHLILHICNRENSSDLQIFNRAWNQKSVRTLYTYKPYWEVNAQIILIACWCLHWKEKKAHLDGPTNENVLTILENRSLLPENVRSTWCRSSFLLPWHPSALWCIFTSFCSMTKIIVELRMAFKIICLLQNPIKLL